MGGLIGIWYNFEGFYQLLFFFELENENLKTLWSLQVSVSSVITGMLLLLIYVINLAMVCENGIYIVSKFNLFYMYFIKREDLEIVKIEKMKFLNQVEVCFVIKTKIKYSLNALKVFIKRRLRKA